MLSNINEATFTTLSNSQHKILLQQGEFLCFNEEFLKFFLHLETYISAIFLQQFLKINFISTHVNYKHVNLFCDRKYRATYKSLNLNLIYLRIKEIALIISLRISKKIC